MIYLDNNATTAVFTEVVEAMRPSWSESYMNPSSSYAPARAVREAVEEARFHVAELIGASPGEIIFTSSATEAINTALGVFRQLSPEKGILHASTDHAAVLSTVEASTLPLLRCGVDDQGRIVIHEWRQLLSGACAGASLTWANNETGVIQDVSSLIEAAHAHQLPVHVDAVQAVGKIPVNLSAIGADYASISAHKFHGPKGIGALYVRTGCRFSPLMRGGDQEDSRRGGTENVPGIIGMGMAAKLAKESLDANYAAMTQLRSLFESLLQEKMGSGITIQSAESDRLPNTSNIAFHDCTAQALSLLLEPQGILCSAGSACKTASPNPSHVLTAMGLSDTQARSCLRFSLSSLTTEEEIRIAAQAIVNTVEKILSVQSKHTGPVVVYHPERDK